MKTNEKYAVVTGAAQGLGQAISESLATYGHNLILISAPDQGLPFLSTYLAKAYHVKTYYFEINMMSREASELTKEYLSAFSINMLINNGITNTETPLNKFGSSIINSILEGNVRFTSLMTRMLFKQLHEQSQSYILNMIDFNISSPDYFISQSLSDELKNSPIHVSTLLLKKTISMPIEASYSNKTISLRKIAQHAVRNMLQKRNLIIPGFINTLYWYFTQLLPMKRQFKLVYKNRQSKQTEGLQAA